LNTVTGPVIPKMHMRQFGKVNILQEAFCEALNMVN
jgi:translation elongation factor EF-4